MSGGIGQMVQLSSTLFRSSQFSKIIARSSGPRSLKLRPRPGFWTCWVAEMFESPTTAASESGAFAIVISCSALDCGEIERLA
jgi:hypothetical protein